MASSGAAPFQKNLSQHALATVLADRTAIVIAHRFSSLEIADQVAVVSCGEVVETGSREELLARPSRFARMHEEWLRTFRPKQRTPADPP